MASPVVAAHNLLLVTIAVAETTLLQSIGSVVMVVMNLRQE
jgi:hypothetical protein